MEDKRQLHLAELETLDQKRLAAQENLELYRQLISKELTNASSSAHWKKGDIVIIIRAPMIINRKKGKLEKIKRNCS